MMLIGYRQQIDMKKWLPNFIICIFAKDYFQDVIRQRCMANKNI